MSPVIGMLTSRATVEDILK